MNRVTVTTAGVLALIALGAAWNYSEPQASETWEITGEILGCETFLIANVEPLWSKPDYGTEYMGTFDSEVKCPPEVSSEFMEFETDKGIFSARQQGEDELVIRFWDPGAMATMSSNEVTALGRRTGTIQMCVEAAAGLEEFMTLKTLYSGEDPFMGLGVRDRQTAVSEFLWATTPKCFVGSFSMVKR